MTLSAGYVKNPEATAAAWRNGWFHTGDLLRRDEAGNFFYVDRSKDALRRRGENISSYEVETQVGAHPAVREAACVPERSGVEVDDEVKVWIVAEQGAAVDFAERRAPAVLRGAAVPRAHRPVPRPRASACRSTSSASAATVRTPGTGRHTASG